MAVDQAAIRRAQHQFVSAAACEACGEGFTMQQWFDRHEVGGRPYHAPCCAACAGD